MHCVRVHAFVCNVSLLAATPTFFALIRSLLAPSECNSNMFRVRNVDIRFTMIIVFVYVKGMNEYDQHEMVSALYSI